MIAGSSSVSGGRDMARPRTCFMRRIRWGAPLLITFGVLFCLEVLPAVAASADAEALITEWYDVWRGTGFLPPRLGEGEELDKQGSTARLAAMAAAGIAPGGNLLDAAFALSALGELLGGESLDAALLSALASSEPAVRADAARGLSLVWERRRVVCPDISNPPVYCPGRGIFYTDDGIRFHVEQLQKAVTGTFHWPLIRTLQAARQFTAVLSNMELEGEVLVASLVQALWHEPASPVRRELARTISSYVKQNTGKAASVLVQAMQQAGDLPDPDLAERLVQLVLPLSSRSSTEALVWIDAFARLGSPAAVPALAYLTQHPAFIVASRAGQAAAGLVGERAVVEHLITGLMSQHELVRWACIQGIATPVYAEVGQVAETLGPLEPVQDAAIARLTALLADPSPSVRRAAAWALAGLAGSGAPVPVDTLLSALNDAGLPEDVRAHVARTLARIDREALDRIEGGDRLSRLHQRVAVYRSGTEGYHTFRIPAVVVTTQGTLLAFAEGRRLSASDTGDIDVVLKRSTDGGRTWGPLQVVWDSGPHTSGNPTPVVDRNTGRIWLFMSHNLGYHCAGGDSECRRSIWVTYSDDDGLTWAEPRDISSDVQSPGTGWDATGPGIGIQLRHGPNPGRLVIPLFWRVVYSDDGGATWQQGGRHQDANESQVVELSDGRLLRNDRPAAWTPANAIYSRRVLAISEDQGLTWQPNRYAWELVTPYVQGSIVRYAPENAGGPEGKVLLFANPDHETERVNMSVWASLDDGETWPYKRSLFSGPSAYSSLAVLPDGTVGILFEGGSGRPYENLYWTTFSLDWVLSDSARPGFFGG